MSKSSDLSVPITISGNLHAIRQFGQMGEKCRRRSVFLYLSIDPCAGNERGGQCAVFFYVYLQKYGRIGTVAEQKVAQAVGDELSFVGFKALQHMGMTANHQIGPGVDAGVSQFALVFLGIFVLFDAPVQIDDSVITLGDKSEISFNRGAWS